MILENLILTAAIITGAIGLNSLGIFHSILYLIFFGTMYLFIIRKFLCTHCSYYGKTCHLGLSKIATKLFEKGSEEKFESRMKKIDLPFWMITIFWPVLGMLFVLSRSFSYYVVLLLGLFISLFAVGFFMIGSRGCPDCERNSECPLGSSLVS